ncbi:MAG: elongation factor P [Candidatus Pelagibacter sp.]|nr:elongation factor P [Candidatus Pelagibacter sp.]|tara:strand:+ start:1086 stop:1649 length:564 start_codon:yes stop_codon:yes gene_type:complete
MKILASEIRPGTVIEYKNDLWRCLKSQAVKPGKGGAFNQVELKSITKDTKLNERFRSGETIERASLDEINYQFLYEDGNSLVFMDEKTFEQVNIPNEIIGDDKLLLKENINAVLEFYDEKPISVSLPKQLEYEILETDAVVKGQTVSSSYKPATIQNNLKIMVPPFVDQGDTVAIDTRTREYIKKIT